MVDESYILDKKLSLEALGFLIRLLAIAEEEYISTKEMNKAFKCGEDRRNKLLTELVERGFLTDESYLNAGGLKINRYSLLNKDLCK